MNEQYTATVYCDEEPIDSQVGNDVEKLYAWMLIIGNTNFGDIHGEIIDNKTNKILRKFRKSPIE